MPSSTVFLPTFIPSTHTFQECFSFPSIHITMCWLSCKSLSKKSNLVSCFSVVTVLHRVSPDLSCRHWTLDLLFVACMLSTLSSVQLIRFQCFMSYFLIFIPLTNRILAPSNALSCLDFPYRKRLTDAFRSLSIHIVTVSNSRLSLFF